MKNHDLITRLARLLACAALLLVVDVAYAAPASQKPRVNGTPALVGYQRIICNIK